MNKVAIISTICTALVIIIICIVVDNIRIKITTYDIKTNKLQKGAKPFTFVQISDLHNRYFGKGNAHLISKIKNINPDAIFITGDLLDRRRPNEECAIQFTNLCSHVATTYYVTGNHEEKYQKNHDIKSKLKSQPIKYMTQRTEVFKDTPIQITGIAGYAKPENAIKNLDVLPPVAKDKFNILLAHCPHLIELYSKYNYDLVLSGHAHGGQFRIPFYRGLYAPHQGILPKYTFGVHKVAGTQMVVSRGLGNSKFPFRIFNPPELVIINIIPE